MPGDNETRCCANCLGDRHLQWSVIPEIAERKGKCSYCGSDNVDLVEPKKLRDYFELLVGIYTTDEQGKYLIDWMKEDWELFLNENLGEACVQLLSDILDDSDVVADRFTISTQYTSDHLHLWEEFRQELKHENRFFPKIQVKLERLEELLSYLIINDDEITEEWFRARLQQSDQVFSVEQMGAPPKHLASHGRANPAGIPYLYLASNDNTAISEIRPHTGELASVANCTFETKLNLIDLRHPRKTVSPFSLADEKDIILLRGDISFLEQLGQELTRPVLPHTAAIDYIPSQYLCEFVKHSGYDGVVYRSSVGDGVNIAVFNPDLAEFKQVTKRCVTKVSVELD